MWHQVHSYREAIGLVRCIYSFVKGRRVLGIWFTPNFGSDDEHFTSVTEAWVNSLLVEGYSFYVASVTEEEWHSAPERFDFYVAQLQRALA